MTAYLVFARDADEEQFETLPSTPRARIRSTAAEAWRLAVWDVARFGRLDAENFTRSYKKLWVLQLERVS